MELVTRKARLTWVFPAIATIIAFQAAWSVAAYWPVFGGDPEIHIIFARNLLQGHPLQFNQGEFTSGETSPVYMALVALLYLAAGDYVPVAMKFVGVTSLAVSCLVIGREARSQGSSVAMAAILGALPLLLPSLIFQAFLGMENMLFAALVVLIMHLWLASPPDGRARPAIAVAVLPVLFFLRPEAAFVGTCLAALAVADRDWRSVSALAFGALITLGAVLAMETWTGVPLQAAGHTRAALTRLDSSFVVLFGQRIYLNGKLAAALVYCAPFVALALLHRRSIGRMRSEAIIFAILFCLPLVLHLIVVFPSTHFSRYFLYGYMVFFLLFARLTARAERGGRTPALGILTVVVLLGATVAPVEHLARGPVSASTLDTAIEQQSPAFVRANSDALYEALGRPPVPVVVAVQEVQLRGKLDQRFIVRSLDGIVDNRLLPFIHDDWVDHVGYIGARDVAFVLELRDYNRDKSKFSLKQLPSLGDRVVADGLCFRRIGLSPEPPDGDFATGYAIARGDEC
jgi:hypothetical protein